ncbi:hypothetical protein CFE70_006141 [Pyrenophora teres f. teres 0-1]
MLGHSRHHHAKGQAIHAPCRDAGKGQAAKDDDDKGKDKDKDDDQIRYGISRRMSLHKPRIGDRAPGAKRVGKRQAAKGRAVPQIKDRWFGGWTSYTRASTCRPMPQTTEDEDMDKEDGVDSGQTDGSRVSPWRSRSKRWEREAAKRQPGFRAGLVRSGDTVSTSATMLRRALKGSKPAAVGQ